MQKGYLVEEIGDGLYWATEGAYQVMFLATGQGVIVCHAPASIGGNILNAIAEVTSQPVTHVILGHSHSDHIGAASSFPGEVTYIGHELTAATLRRHQDPRRPVPSLTFTDAYTLEVGSQTLVLDYRGVNHEPGNIFVYAPRQRVLFFVDVIFPGWVPFKNCAMTEDVPGFLNVLPAADAAARAAAWSPTVRIRTSGPTTLPARLDRGHKPPQHRERPCRSSAPTPGTSTGSSPTSPSAPRRRPRLGRLRRRVTDRGLRAPGPADGRPSGRDRLWGGQPEPGGCPLLRRRDRNADGGRLGHHHLRQLIGVRPSLLFALSAASAATPPRTRARP
jgi:glyoxylase-like metal-dependent hydrolase (beta-lactamase superfamily II)